ncbi:MAG: GNAT family N-acetyltransferase [Phaeodactylibacter sp.]|nr:GNAT family N-acetyltransferase [Phaeodactylibacter sp.]
MDECLVGLGNAISDGYLVVYYPHLLVHPDYHGKGIGKMIVDQLQERYKGFHMQMLTADERAVSFYKKVGFERAGATTPMWIYKGNEH